MITKTTITLSFLSFATFLGGMLLARWDMVPPLAGLALFVLGGMLGMAAVGFAIAVMFTGQGYGVAMAGMLGALPFIALLGGALGAMRYPAINDITTDPDNPPAILGEDKPARPAGEIIRRYYPDIVALTCDLPPRNRLRASPLPRPRAAPALDDHGRAETGTDLPRRGHHHPLPLQGRFHRACHPHERRRQPHRHAIQVPRGQKRPRRQRPPHPNVS